MDTLVSVSVLPPCVVEIDERGKPWCVSQERTRSRVSGCGATSSATYSLERWAPYPHPSSGTGEYTSELRSGEEDVLWMPGVADLVQGIDQGALPVGLESNVQVDGGACGRVAQALPVFRDGVPRVLRVHVVPTL
jgi:hypothetical protein